MIENPNWWEVNQLAILQAWWRIWTRNYQEQIQLSGLELQITSPKKKKKIITSPALGHTASFFTPRPHNLLHSLMQKLSP